VAVALGVVSIVVCGLGLLDAAGTQSQTLRATVSGTVVEASSGSPVAGALVSLAGDRRVLSDARGRFVFENVPPGAYGLEASKPGYADGAFGRRRPGGSSQTFDVRPGVNARDVAVPLWKHAAIGGRLVDEAGEPVVDVQVQLLRDTVVAGRRAVVSVATALTDDRGAYRFSGVLAGRYLIAMAAIPTTVPAATAEGFKQAFYDGQLGNLPNEFRSGGVPIASVGSAGTRVGSFIFQTSTGSVRPPVVPQPEAGGRVFVYPTQFFPGVARLVDASVVTVATGQNRIGLDWQLQLVPGASITGVVTGPAGAAAHVGVRLVPASPGDRAWEPAIEAAASMTDATGRFTFLGVPAGQYLVVAQRVPTTSTVQAIPAPSGQRAVGGGRGGGPRVPRPVVPGPTLWASMPIAVGAAGLDNVALTLAEGYRISGRLEFDGTAPPPASDTWSQISVLLEPADGRTNPLGVTLPLEGFVDRDGTITTYAVPPGRYFMRATSLPEGWFLRSVAFDGADLADTPLSLRQDTTGVVITLTDRTASLQGTVRTGQGAADDAAAVVVFPANREAWSDTGLTPRRLRLARVSPAGAFRVDRLPAGNYLAAAIPEEQSADWQTPAVLEALARSAQTVSLREGDDRTVDLVTRALASRVIHTVWSRPSPGQLSPIAGESSQPDDSHGPWVGPDEDGSPVRSSGGIQQVRDPLARSATSGTAVLSGTIVSDDQEATPIRRVRVLLSASSSSVDREAVTDDEGRFVFVNLPAAAYRVSAFKAGYLRTEHGATRPQQPGTPVVVTDGQRQAITLRLPRGAVIEGTILDHDGTPAPGVTVSVLREAFSSRAGRRVLAAVAAVRRVTDDRGIYRFYGLLPGEYVVAAVPAPERLGLPETPVGVARWDAPDARARDTNAAHMGFARAYYPGTTTASQAERVTVAVGEERLGVGFAMPLVRTARITGAVIGAGGAPASGLTVERVVQGEPALSAFEESGRSWRVRCDAAGQFAFDGVEPGRYQLTVRGPAGPTDQSSSWASADVDVFGANVTVQLSLQPTLTVSGRIAASPEAGGSPDLSRVRVGLAPERGAGTGLLSTLRAATPDSSGRFVIDGVVPGRYRLVATAPAEEARAWTPASVIVRGNEVLDLPFDVGFAAPVADAVVRFDDRATRVTGRLIDADDRPVVNRAVIVFAADPAYWAAQTRRIALRRPEPDGRFTVDTLPPGDYLIAVAADLDGGDWLDPQVLEEFLAAGVPITLAAGATVTQDLRVVARYDSR
jgi:protocatechuate 3,4-dioxygenase beta subunit